MPELPKVTQDFTADVSGYVSELNAAIAVTNQFKDAIGDVITEVGKLDAALKALPDAVTTTIKLVGMDEALAQTAKLKQQIDDIPTIKTTTVFVKYVTQGAPEAVAEATQLVKQTTIPGDQNIPVGTEFIVPEEIKNSPIPAIVNMGLGNLGGEDYLGAPMSNINAGGGAAAAAASAADAAALNQVASNAERANGALAGLTAVLGQNAAAMSQLRNQSSGASGGLLATAAAVSVSARWWSTYGNIVHWVIAAGAEWAAVAIPGMIAMGAAMMDSAQAATNVYQRLQAMYTVQEALGPAINKTMGDMLGLGHSFQSAQNALQPQLYEIFGAGLEALKTHLGDLAGMGSQVINIFSTFAAKVDIELKGALGQELAGLISKGVQDFTEFGQILGNVGHAILNFAAAMPGLAEVLLKVLDALSFLLKLVSEIPAPIITAAMALEEFLRWGSLLVLLFSKLGAGIGMLVGSVGFEELGAAISGASRDAGAAAGSFSGLFKTIVTFAAENPLIAVIVAIVAALTIFGIWVSKAKSGTDQWIDSVNKAVNSAPDFQQLNVSMEALGATTKNLQSAQDVLNTKTSAWDALASGAKENVTALQQEHQQLVGTITTESSNVGFLANRYGVDMPTAIAIAQAAGVKLNETIIGNSQAAQINRQKIDNMLEGYQALGQQGNQVAADINAVTIASSGQLSNVQKLNQAWTTVIGLGSGMQTTFIRFEQGLQTIKKDADTAGASFNGLNAQSLTLRSDFQANITNMSNSLGSLNTALSFGGIQWNQYRSAIATMVGEMMHAGNLSSAQKSQLGEIASAAGYTGTSYSSLAGWVSKFGGSENQLNNTMNQATIALSNQKGLVQQLQGTLQSDVIDTTAQAVLQQGGFTSALNKTYEAFKKGGDSTSQFKKDLADVDQQLKAAGFSQTQITQYNKELEKSWTEAGSGADNLSGKTKNLNNSFDQTKIKSDGLRDEIKNVFIAIGHYVEDYTDAAREAVVKGWNAIVSNVTKIGSQIGTDVKHAWDSVASFTSSAWNGIKQIADGLWQDTLGVIRSLAGQFDGWWKTHGEAIKQIWQTVWNAIKQVAQMTWADIVGLANAFWAGLKGTWDVGTAYIRGLWTTFWNFLKQDVEWFWNGVKPIIELGWNIIKITFDSAMTVIKAAFSIFWNTLSTIARDVFDGIYAGIKMVWDLIVGAFNIFIDLLTGHWKTMWQDIKNLASQEWNAVYNFFKQAWSNFSGWAKNTFHTIGTDLVQGLKNGIMSAASAIGSFVKNYLVDPIVNAVKHFFGIASPSTVFAGIGGNLVSGLLKGLEHSPDALIKDVFGSWPSALGKLLGKGLIDIAKLPTKLFGTLEKDLGGLFSKLFGSGGGVSGNAAANQALGKAMAAAVGWTGAQWDAFNAVVMDESGWNAYAANPTSDARGIAQNISGWSASYQPGNAEQQIAWMISYISGRYGSPEGALAHENAFHWYDSGGWLMPGLTFAMNGTGQPERILGPNEGPGTDYVQHTVVNLDGQKIWENMQRRTLQYNMRNNGNGRQATGAMAPR